MFSFFTGDMFRTRYLSLVGAALIMTVPVPATAQDAIAMEEENQPSVFEVDADVQEILFPLFRAVRDAQLTRTTVELFSETIVAGEVVDTRRSRYEIASKLPGSFTIYYKESEQQTRIYNNANGMTIALAPDAYVDGKQSLSVPEAVDELPVAMGTYPEPILALSLAGYDPAIVFVGGMKSLKMIDRLPFRGKVPAVHVRGVQDDLVTWDLWLSDSDPAKPLRLIVDLTPMLKASEQVRVPAGYRYKERYDFLSWRVTGTVSDSLFSYRAKKDARKFESTDQYFESLAGVVDDHPLLGKPIPTFAAQTLEGTTVTAAELANKVVVLDFWSTWCGPCIAAMPTVARLSDKYKEAVFLTINIGESDDKVAEFMTEQDWDLPVLLDPKGEIAEAFKCDAIPMRVLIGKSGLVESVHVGFRTDSALSRQLSDELGTLLVGGDIDEGR